MTITLDAIIPDYRFEDFGSISCNLKASDTDASDGKVILVFTDERLSDPENENTYVLWLSVPKVQGITHCEGLLLE